MSTVRGILEQFFRQFEASYEAINSIDLSASALLFNFEYLKRIHNVKNVMPVLKGNAYGHGLAQVLKILEDREDIPYIAVDGYNEALEIRAISDFKVLVMGAVLPENFNKIETKNIAYVIQDKSVLNVLTNSRRSIRVHLEFNTGLNRQGFDESEVNSVISLLKDNDQIELDGLMSQYYDAANADQSSVIEQEKRFINIVQRFRKAKLKPPHIHIAKSSGLLKEPHTLINSIRVGSGLFGINLADTGHPFYKQLEELKPVMKFSTRVIKIREIQKGDGIGYGHKFKAGQKILTAVVPVGYIEGVNHTLANKGEFTYKNHNLPILGGISMNHTVLDISQKPVKLWDKLIVINPDPAAPNSLKRLWKDHDLYPLVVTSKISDDVRRRIVK